MSTTTDKAAQVASLRLRVDNCLGVCQIELAKEKPCFDLAYDFAEKALNAIGTLRIMAATAARSANGGGV